MKMKNPFKALRTRSRRDRHKNSIKVRMLKGDYKALKIVAQDRHIPIIKAMHQAVVMLCTAAVYEDMMKHEQRRLLVMALCQGAGISSKKIEKLIPKTELPDETPAAAAPERTSHPPQLPSSPDNKGTIRLS